MNRNRSAFALALAFLALTSPLAAFCKGLSRDQISKINHSLLNNSTVIADFTQISENEKSEGVLYIDRKNKRVAIDYLSGNTNIKVISDKFRQYYIDKDLKQASIIPSGSVAAKALLNQNINSGLLIIDEVNENDDEISISCSLKGHREEGDLIIKFKKGNVNEFFFINIKDPQTGGSVSMLMKNIRVNARIQRSVFQAPDYKDLGN